ASGTNMNEPPPSETSPIAWSWRSEPPSSVIGSNTPPATLPKRVSARPVVPPTGAAWQGAHPASLKTRPTPSPTLSTSPNRPLPPRVRAGGPPRPVRRVGARAGIAQRRGADQARIGGNVPGDVRGHGVRLGVGSYRRGRADLRPVGFAPGEDEARGQREQESF